jgi:hypothetical protein
MIAPNRYVQAGMFSTPKLSDLRMRVQELNSRSMVDSKTAPLVRITNITGDSTSMHCEIKFKDAVFQAASQFNCLEFIDPSVTPEAGITDYAFDKTQGPACAIACAAGTAQRNYFPHGVEHPPQSADQQINTLADLDHYFCARVRNAVDGSPLESLRIEMEGLQEGNLFYKVRNGYTFASESSLHALNRLFLDHEEDREALRGLIRIGVQKDTEVTEERAGRTFAKVIGQDGKSLWKLVPEELPEPFLVTQTYNSAISISYDRSCSVEAWKPFACLILEATYEATLLVGALVNLERALRSQSLVPVLLTKVGGGVFGNRPEWIIAAIQRAANQV